MVGQEPRRGLAWKALAGGVLLAGILPAASLCRGQEGTGFQSPNMFEPRSTPADSIFNLSILVFELTGLIFAVVFSFLVYAIVRFRKRATTTATNLGRFSAAIKWTLRGRYCRY
jgi:heme/copper-type cytochrome/quinol oxidase subunit 2